MASRMQRANGDEPIRRAGSDQRARVPATAEAHYPPLALAPVLASYSASLRERFGSDATSVASMVPEP